MARAKVLIAGAGLGGLACASCLMQAGFEVEVYEQAPFLGEVGAGIQISPNAIRVLEHLGLREKLLSVGFRPRSYVFRIHDTGEVIREFKLSGKHEALYGAPYVTVHRADLLDIFLGRVREFGPEVIRLDHRVVAVDEQPDHVEISFANGQTAQGDVLIGADGIKSLVRSRIFGEVPAIYTGDGAWRVTVPTDDLPPGLVPPDMTVFVGPGKHAVIYYIRGGKLVNFIGTVEQPSALEESWTLRLPWDRLQAEYRGWHPIVRTVIDAADRNQCLFWTLHNREPIRVWSTPRTTLLGDAAHPTLPYLAQGAVMAIEDAAILTRSLVAAASVQEALQTYERNRIDRTGRVVRESNDNRRLFHLDSVEDLREGFAHRDDGRVRSRGEWLYGYDPVKVPLV